MALRDYYNTGDDLGKSINPASGYWRAQTFLASENYSITQIRLLLYREGSPGIVTVALYNTDGTEPTTLIASGTFAGNDITADTDGEWVSVDIATSIIVSGTTYAIVLDDANSSSGNRILWRSDENAGYLDGGYYWTGNSGSSWNAALASDLMFECRDSAKDMAATGGGLSTALATITVGEAEGTAWPEERPVIDSGLRWDELSGTWVSSIVGLGRHKTSVIAIGQGDANEGVIYFGAM